MTSKPSTTNCPKLSSGLPPPNFGVRGPVTQTLSCVFFYGKKKSSICFACGNTSPYTADKSVDELTSERVNKLLVLWTMFNNESTDKKTERRQG